MPLTGRRNLEVLIRVREAGTKALADLDRRITRLRGNLNALPKALFSLKAGFAALGLGLVARDFVRTAESFEKLRTQLETVTGSAKEAEKAMAWITDFTAKTPYELEQVANAFAKLSAYGVDARKKLGVLGDTAAAMGKSLDQAVEMFADAITGEFERLKEFGVRASQQGDQVTFRWMQNGQQMVKVAEKTQEGISRALTEILAGRFEGAMARYSKTWAGMMSNLKDQFTLFKEAVMKAGVFEYLKGALSKLLELVNRLKKEGRLDQWARDVAQKVILAFKGIAYAAAGVGESFRGWKMLFQVLKIAFNSFALAFISGLKAMAKTARSIAGFLGLDNMAAKLNKAVHEMTLMQEVLVEGIGDAEKKLGKLTSEGSYFSKVSKLFKQIGDRGRKLKTDLGETAKATGKLAKGFKEILRPSEAAKGASAIERLKQSTQTALAVLGRAYSKGELGLKEYFARREALIKAQFDKEIAYLQSLASGEKDPTKRLALEDKVFAKRQERERALIALAQQREQAEKALAQSTREVNAILEDLRFRSQDLTGAGALEAQFQRELAELDRRHQEEIQRLQEQKAKKEQIDEAYRLQKLEKDKLLADQERRLGEYRVALARDVAGGIAQTFEAVYDLTGRKNKEMFYLAKAAALAEAIINTAQAATKALAQGGIMGPAMAAIVTAQGAVQIARIAAQRLRHGGFIQEGSGSKDDVPALLMRGEYVLRKEAVSKYGLRFIEALNRGLIDLTAFVRNMPPLPISQPKYAFATGGVVRGSTSAARTRDAEPGFNIINVIDPNLIDEYVASTRGQRVLLNVISQNAPHVRRILSAEG